MGSLKEYFPNLREREELLAEIKGSPELCSLFYSWQKKERENFINMCTGVSGMKILYDAFFKEIMNPETDPARLENFLSLLLGRKVTILKVLPTDNSRLTAEKSLLIMDILLEFEDGMIANLEVQKIGYDFPGQRAACYSADLLLRQYKRVRDRRKDSFTYRDVCPVYVIVLFEKSQAIFHAFPDTYIHRMKPESDTGLSIELLQNYIFIPLDIFKEKTQNGIISNKLEAWLTFFCKESPEDIIRLIKAYPEFKRYYEDAYELCRNTERVMHMFSEELAMLDANTVQYMIDEQQEIINEQKQELDRKDEELGRQKVELDRKDEELDRQKVELDRKDEELGRKDAELGRKDEELGRKDAELGRKDEELQKALARIRELEGQI